MAAPLHTLYRSMGSYVNVYTFRHKGDVLPVHNHPVDHDAIVAQGKLRTLNELHEDVIFGPGHKLTMHAPHDHGFVALEDNTILLNIFKDTGQIK